MEESSGWHATAMRVGVATYTLSFRMLNYVLPALGTLLICYLSYVQFFYTLPALDAATAQQGEYGAARPRISQTWALLQTVAVLMTSITLAALSLALFVECLLSKPGYVAADEPDDDAASKDEPVVRVFPPYGTRAWCDKCPIKSRPFRARHCTVCRHCVHGFDHHCPWIATCVGTQNRGTFLLMLWTLAAGALFAGLCALESCDSSFIGCVARGPSLRRPRGVQWTASTSNRFAVSVLGATIGSLLLLMAMWWTYLAITNQTTPEFHRCVRRFGVWRLLLHGTHLAPSSLGMGAINLIAHFCGDEAGYECAGRIARFAPHLVIKDEDDDELVIANGQRIPWPEPSFRGEPPTQWSRRVAARLRALRTCTAVLVNRASRRVGFPVRHAASIARHISDGDYDDDYDDYDDYDSHLLATDHDQVGNAISTEEKRALLQDKTE